MNGESHTRPSSTLLVYLYSDNSEKSFLFLNLFSEENTLKKFMALALLVVAPFLTGCAANLSSSVAPEATFDELGKTYVIKFEPDKRYLNRTIADKLSMMGYPAVAGKKSEIPDDVDTLVTYKDYWHWDITNYMKRIKIQFRDANTRKLIVKGESFRTSLVRKSPEAMIEETLVEIFKKKTN